LFKIKLQNAVSEDVRHLEANAKICQVQIYVNWSPMFV